MDEKRRTLWLTSWGVVLAASSAFTLGYGASRSATPSIGASRPPGWPLFITVFIVAVSLWFVLAPKLHRWPFEERPVDDSEVAEPWLAELGDTGDPQEAPLGTFRIETGDDQPAR